VFDASGEYLFVPCLGSNYVLQYRFMSGTLAYNSPATVAVSGGPRHIALDPQQKHAYVLSEQASTITWFSYDAASGKLSNPQTINGYSKQAGASAHIVVHPSGKWLYASNRKENSLGLFTLDAATGRPEARKFETDMLAEPRDFSIDPTGTFLILANQGSDKPSSAQTVILYRIDAQNGELTRAQVVPNGQQPSFTLALVLP
jgi:6-phosphogluconolactonase